MSAQKWCGSFGTFVNVTSHSPSNWLRHLLEVQRLPRYEHIEVWLEWLPQTKSEMNDLKKMFGAEKIIVHAPFVGVSLSSPWRELRSASIRRLLEAAAAADALGASVMTIHPGISSVFENRDEVLDRVASAYDKISRQMNGVLAVENMPDRRTASAEGVVSMVDFADLLNRNSAMKLTLDIGHALQNDDKYEQFLVTHGAAVVNMHLHDGHAGGAGHLRIGKGDLDLDGFLQTCADLKYQGFASLETLGSSDTAASWDLVGAASRARDLVITNRDPD